MNQEEQEEATNDVIAVVWPLLDEGATKEEIRAILNNVLDAWTPKN